MSRITTVRGGEGMERGIWLQIDEEELDAVFKELEQLQTKLYDCYDRLRRIPIVVIKKASPDEATPREKD